MMKFDAQVYWQFRPQYPAELAYLLRSLCLTHLASDVVGQLVDIGCGTGFSTAVFVENKLAHQFVAVEPDLSMLLFAKQDQRLQQCVQFINSHGETTGLQSASCDVVAIGSAFHWMDQVATKMEIMRVLKRPGLVFFFEYRFPRSASHQDFNDWIHQKLKVEWEIPQLRDRGSLEELLQIFSIDSEFQTLGFFKIPMDVRMNADEVIGLLKSQSRYLRFVEKLSADQRLKLDAEIEREIQSRLGGGLGEEFDFGLRAAAFKLLPVPNRGRA